MAKFSTLVVVCSLAAFAAPSAISRIAPYFSDIQISDRQNCVIKGNVSINSGERIYHVPGQKFYVPTKISPQYGERWFCSEADARAAGWRKARR